MIRIRIMSTSELLAISYNKQLGVVSASSASLDQFPGSKQTKIKECFFLFSGNRNRKLLISRAPTKAKSQEPAYSQALNQNKIDRQRSRSRESGRQTVRRLWWMVFGVETGR